MHLVVISHEHDDHCGLDAFRRYPDKDVPLLVAGPVVEKAGPPPMETGRTTATCKRSSGSCAGATMTEACIQVKSVGTAGRTSFHYSARKSSPR